MWEQELAGANGQEYLEVVSHTRRKDKGRQVGLGMIGGWGGEGR